MRKAFTLAEVLITLGIIGVVFAMTLPTLIHKTENLKSENLKSKPQIEHNCKCGW